jgi:CBS-domain-containing membrane protein
VDPRRLAHHAVIGVHARIKDIMTTSVVAVRPDASYREMAGLLRAHRISGLPVVDPEGIVVGVVSETDDVILDGFFTDPDRLTVTVKDGIVTLAGAPGSVVLGRNIAHQARHVEGVVAVRDRFTYPSAAPAS